MAEKRVKIGKFQERITKLRDLILEVKGAEPVMAVKIKLVEEVEEDTVALMLLNDAADGRERDYPSAEIAPTAGRKESVEVLNECLRLIGSCKKEDGIDIVVKKINGVCLLILGVLFSMMFPLSHEKGETACLCVDRVGSMELSVSWD